MPRFPIGLPPLDPAAPHIIPADQRERIAQEAVAGKSPLTRAADLHEARWAVDAIDAAFARGKIDRDRREHAAQQARRQQIAQAAE